MKSFLKNPDIRRAVWCGGLLLVGVTLYAALWFLLTTVHHDLIVTKEELMVAEAAQENLREARLFVHSVSSERALLEGTLVDARDMVPFFERMEQVAAESSVSLEILSVGEPAPLKKEQKKKDTSKKSDTSQKEALENITPLFIPISLEANGSFEGTYRFLKRIEVFPYASMFTTVRMTHEEKVRTSSPYEVGQGRREAPRGAWTLKMEIVIPLRATLPASSAQKDSR